MYKFTHFFFHFHKKSTAEVLCKIVNKIIFSFNFMKFEKILTTRYSIYK